MRIISGKAKGRRIEALEGTNTRPSGARVKESLFGILQFYIEDAVVLDLFSGSGNLAFEALSRGAAHAVCNDNNANAVKLISRNAKALRMDEQIELMHLDYSQCLSSLSRKLKRFDLIFIDPPYASDYAMKSLIYITQKKLLSNTGIAVVERDSNTPWFPEELPPEGLEVYDTRKYSSTYLEFVRYSEESD